jgi:hypothetical protein
MPALKYSGPSGEYLFLVGFYNPVAAWHPGGRKSFLNGFSDLIQQSVDNFVHQDNSQPFIPASSNIDSKIPRLRKRSNGRQQHWHREQAKVMSLRKLSFYEATIIAT